MNRKYVIIDASEVSSVDFSHVLETSESTLNFSADGSKTFVKFEGSTPSFLEGKPTLSSEEMRQLLSTSDWALPSTLGE